MSPGLSLLLVRPQVLLASLHNLVITLALSLSGNPVSNAAVHTFGDLERSRGDNVAEELYGELAMGQEVMDKVRGMESKLEYQIKKLMALAEEKQVEDEEGKLPLNFADLDPLSFRPNMAAMVVPKAAQAGPSEIYRPPRVAAVPYHEPAKQRKERRAPALLSEFASTLEGAPGMETTSGLSTMPVRADRHSNSASAKRAAELKRINEFEEENMTRLVTTKREAKRRREDETALALGYGVGGSGRSRGNRQNGLEAELEGVLGERRSGGVWDGVGAKLGARKGLLERGKKGVTEGKAKKARFEKDVKNS